MRRTAHPAPWRLAGPVALALACGAASGAAWAASGAEAGQTLYRSGQAEPPVTARLLPSGRVVDAARGFACANCHGIDGAGGAEGTGRPPPLVWSALASPRTAGGGARARPAYDEDRLVRAVTAGIDADGRTLDPLMPRFSLTSDQAAALVVYLKVVGTEDAADPGIAEDSLRIGTLQPLSGPLALTGTTVEATLRRFCALVNQSGGVYGRRLELVARDAGLGQPGGAEAAARLLVEEDRVFAVLAPFEGGGDRAGAAAVRAYLQGRGTPLVGPLGVPDAEDATTAPAAFFLLPSFREQGRVLVDHAAAGATAGGPAPRAPLRVVILHGPDAPAREAAQGAEAQALLHGFTVAARGLISDARDPSVPVVSLPEARPDLVFVFAAAPTLAAVAEDLGKESTAKGEGSPPALYALTLLLGPGSASALRNVAIPVLLGHPFAPMEAGGAFRRFGEVARLDFVHPVLQGLAYAAAAAFTEGLKQAGRRLSRPGFVAAMEHLTDLRTGVLPPLHYARGQHGGPRGLYLVGLSAETGALVVRAGPREPVENGPDPKP